MCYNEREGERERESERERERQVEIQEFACAAPCSMSCSVVRCKLVSHGICVAQSAPMDDFLGCDAMFHNKKSGDNIFESPTKRLRQHVHTLFLDSKLSGQETQLLENQIGACHVQGFKEHAGPSVNVSKKAARDMLRRCLKGTKWPKIYTAEIRIWDGKLQVEKYAKVALLLPHELLHVLGTMNSAETLTQLDGAVESVQAHCRKAQRAFGSPTCGFGLWSDATPFNWDRTKTLEIILISFPGLEPPHHTVRIPVCAIPHELVLKEKTFQDILASLHGASSAWPFNSCPTTGKMAVLGASQKTIGGNNGKAYPCLVLVFLLKCDVIGNVKLKCLAFPAGSKKLAFAANALPPRKPSLTSLPMLCGGPKDTATGIFWRNSNPWTGQGLLFTNVHSSPPKFLNWIGCMLQI